MILGDLVSHYELLAEDGQIAREGYAPVKVSCALRLDPDGAPTGVLPLMEDVQAGKKTVRRPKIMTLPMPEKRTVGLAANFLYDTSNYVLGVDEKGKPARTILKTDKGRIMP